MKKINFKKKNITLNPIMTFIILIAVTIVLSAVLSLVGFETSYTKINAMTGDYESVLVSVDSLFNLSGIKYIFSETLSNFVSFTPLSMLIIILIGIGIMEKSGFLKTAFTLLCRYTKKYTLTFVLVLLCVMSSIVGDLGYVIFIPLSALLFKYGKRNPLLGIITAFAGLTCGTGISIFLTSIDSSLMNLTLNSALGVNSSYSITLWSYVFIMFVATFVVSFVITYVTEKIMAYKLVKYEHTDDDSIEILNEEENVEVINKQQLRGLVIGLIAGLVYLLIVIYNIIPGLPLSGNLLDNSQTLYIDKLFSYTSFFSNGFVFIVTMFFLILGLFYGIGGKTIKNNNDFCDNLGHSLDGTGKTLVLIFIASILISVFKKTNIGTVFTAYLANFINSSNFVGIPLLFLIFIIGALSTLFLSNSVAKWTILSTVAVQLTMHSGISAEFAQIAFRFGESMTLGITPICAYFVIYLAFLEKYTIPNKPISFFKSIKYVMLYSMATGLALLLLLIVWYITGLPIGIATSLVI